MAKQRLPADKDRAASSINQERGVHQSYSIALWSRRNWHENAPARQTCQSRCIEGRHSIPWYWCATALCHPQWRDRMWRAVVWHWGEGSLTLHPAHKIAGGVGPLMCKVLPAFHALSRCDTTSALSRVGRKEEGMEDYYQQQSAPAASSLCGTIPWCGFSNSNRSGSGSLHLKLAQSFQ